MSKSFYRMKCNQDNASLIYMFFQCPRVIMFWEDVISYINLTLNQSLIFMDAHIILHYMEIASWTMEMDSQCPYLPEGQFFNTGNINL